MVMESKITREKQLNNAAFDYVNQGGTTAEWSDDWEDFSDAEYVEEAFKAGAEWEHKRLIEEVCEWLDKNITNYKSDMMGYIEYSQISDIIQDIRKAMEE